MRIPDAGRWLIMALLLGGCATAEAPEAPPGTEDGDPVVAMPAFRAVGQEPGWLVEVFPGDSMRFLLDYGETLLTTAAPAQDSTEAAIVWRTLDPRGAIELRATRATCHDAMSGEAFPATVTLTVGDRSLTGCGRWP